MAFYRRRPYYRRSYPRFRAFRGRYRFARRRGRYNNSLGGLRQTTRTRFGKHARQKLKFYSLVSTGVSITSPGATSGTCLNQIPQDSTLPLTYTLLQQPYYKIWNITLRFTFYTTFTSGTTANEAPVIRIWAFIAKNNNNTDWSAINQDTFNGTTNFLVAFSDANRATGDYITLFDKLLVLDQPQVIAAAGYTKSDAIVWEHNIRFPRGLLVQQNSHTDTTNTGQYIINNAIVLYVTTNSTTLTPRYSDYIRLSYTEVS